MARAPRTSATTRSGSASISSTAGGDRPPRGRGRPGRCSPASPPRPDRIELGPLVACTAFHNPAILAKRADTIDEISGGRLILGLGAGWNETEFRAFGIPVRSSNRPVRGGLHDHPRPAPRRRDRLRRALLPGPRLRAAAARAAGRQRRAAADDRLERRADAPDHGPPRRRLELLVRGHRQHAGGRRAAPRQGRRGGARRPVAIPAAIERTVAVQVRMPGGTGRTMGDSDAKQDVAPLQGSPEAMADGAPGLRPRGDRPRPARPRPDHPRIDRGIRTGPRGARSRLR